MKVLSGIFFLLFTMSSCTIETPIGFNSPKELKVAYKTAFNSGNKEDLVKMVYWGDTPKELRKLYDISFSMGLGKHIFEKIDIVPFDSLPMGENLTGKEVEPIIQLTHWLIGSHKGYTGYKGAETVVNIQLAVGEINGLYYLSGVRYKKQLGSDQAN